MMFTRRQWRRISGLYGEYPSRLWTLVVLTLFDAIGGAQIFLSFCLYVTYHVGVGMTDIGKVIAAAAGPMLAGTILDNFDPRWMWYTSGLIGLLGVGKFLLLHRQATSRDLFPIEISEALPS